MNSIEIKSNKGLLSLLIGGVEVLKFDTEEQMIEMLSKFEGI